MTLLSACMCSMSTSCILKARIYMTSSVHFEELAEEPAAAAAHSWLMCRMLSGMSSSSRVSRAVCALTVVLCDCASRVAIRIDSSKARAYKLKCSC